MDAKQGEVAKLEMPKWHRAIVRAAESLLDFVDAQINFDHPVWKKALFLSWPSEWNSMEDRIRIIGNRLVLLC